jgi:hypothetical protein
LVFLYDVIGGNAAVINTDSTLGFDKAADLSYLDFYGARSTLDLSQPQNFSGLLNNFNTGDTIHLLGAWHETSYSYSGGHSLLELSHSGLTTSLEFQGDVGGIQVITGVGATAIVR